jgi:hypothetical protein
MNNNIEIASNNCQLPKGDCFHKNGLQQLGVNPFNQPPTLSEIAFQNRYDKIGGKKKKRKLKKKSKKKYKNSKGGQGYYFDLKNNINGLPIIKSYNLCCPPLYNSELLKGGKKKITTIKI